MTKKCEIDVVLSNKLSKDDKRYVIINKETGEVLDDAQGYGYRTKRNAYSSWGHKHRKQIPNEKKIKKWIKQHPKFQETVNNDIFFDIKHGGKGKINKEYIESILVQLELEDILNDFSSEEILKVLKII